MGKFFCQALLTSSKNVCISCAACADEKTAFRTLLTGGSKAKSIPLQIHSLPSTLIMQE